jgi:hypothetical protein
MHRHKLIRWIDGKLVLDYSDEEKARRAKAKGLKDDVPDRVRDQLKRNEKFDF